MLFLKLFKKLLFDLNADRIGPDIPFTHWKLHFPSLMLKLCKKKFQFFSKSAQVRSGAYIVGCSKISIGEFVVIRPGCKLFGESDTLSTSIIINDFVLIGCGVNIYVTNHNFDRIDIPIYHQGHYDSKQVVLKKGCWIGANSIILPGVIIGENSVVGAGSIVTKSVPDNTLVVGNPAKVIRRLC